MPPWHGCRHPLGHALIRAKRGGSVTVSPGRCIAEKARRFQPWQGHTHDTFRCAVANHDRERRQLISMLRVAVCLGVVALAAPLHAEPRPSIAMHGEPALRADFAAFPYVNPDAPKQGRIVYGVKGSFDSLNPFIVKGAPAAAINTLVFETLMRRSADEPFSFYPSLAKSIDMPDDRSFVEFEIDDHARFSDGKPVTAEDVAFTFELMKAHGRPNTRQSYAKVSKVEVKGDRGIRFDLGESGDRELPLILASMV